MSPRPHSPGPRLIDIVYLQDKITTAASELLASGIDALGVAGNVTVEADCNAAVAAVVCCCVE